jgi:hypothetical protein
MSEPTVREALERIGRFLSRIDENKPPKDWKAFAYGLQFEHRIISEALTLNKR